MDTGLLIEKSALVLILFLISLGIAAYQTYFERKLAAWIQDRVGPDRAGPFGILQPIADGVKMFLKEDFIPKDADKWLFIIGPGIAMFTSLITSAIIPWGTDLQLFGRTITLQVADFDIGILYLFAVLSISVYGIMLMS
jgi:NADH-quinone oxidoreductase subunit H